jgi:hypothetical protein
MKSLSENLDEFFNFDEEESKLLLTDKQIKKIQQRRKEAKESSKDSAKDKKAGRDDDDDDERAPAEILRQTLVELLFRHMSGLKKKNDNIHSAKVNFMQFLNAFQLVLPKKAAKVSAHKFESDLQQEKQRLLRDTQKKEQRLGFDILDVDGDELMNIYDLLFACPAFSRVTPLGDQLGMIYDKNMRDNIKSKDFRSKFVIDFNSFHNMCPKLMLVDDIKAVFARVPPKPEKDSLDDYKEEKKKNKDLQAALSHKFSFLMGPAYNSEFMSIKQRAIQSNQ